MNIFCFVHGYPPAHNAGAEWMLHTMNRFLCKRGHDIRVMVRSQTVVDERNGRRFFKRADMPSEFEGIKIFRLGVDMWGEHFRWADVVVTHLDLTGKAMNLARHCFQKPLVHLMHNTHLRDEIRVMQPWNNYLVYNSEWNREYSIKTLGYKNKNIVVYPPVFADDYKVRKMGNNITLINCFESKGGKQLIDIAKEMPKRKFLGVIGGYGNQVIGNLNNLTYTPNTPDIKTVYRKTRILLMPSVYESWGRTGIEAMASGIPVIAHPTPGLRESLGDAGLFADRDNIGHWIKHIEALDDEKYYKEVSDRCRKRAQELSDMSEQQLLMYEDFLETIKRKGYADQSD